MMWRLMVHCFIKELETLLVLELGCVSSNCLQCHISISSAKANYCVCQRLRVCVFCQSAYHCAFIEQKHAVPCRVFYWHQASFLLSDPVFVSSRFSFSVLAHFQSVFLFQMTRIKAHCVCLVCWGYATASDRSQTGTRVPENCTKAKLHYRLELVGMHVSM